jgi:glycosyltransferase involved in cell wall biosynthesis
VTEKLRTTDPSTAVPVSWPALGNITGVAEQLHDKSPETLLPIRRYRIRGDYTVRPEALSPTVSLIIPTLNEAANIPFVLDKIDSFCEIILVDGHSTDGTVDVARRIRPDIKVVHQTRRGKGNALACGFAASSGDIIVMLDADGSADPGEVGAFVGALIEGADFAKGSRSVHGGGSDDLTLIRRAGNKALSGIVNILFRRRFTDLCYGYNAFWRHCLAAIDMTPGPSDGVPRWGDGFEVETLINIRIAMARLTVTEVPSFEHARLFGVSNLNAVSDGIRVLRTIMREWWQARIRRRRYSLSAAEVRLPVQAEPVADKLVEAESP